MGRAQHLWGSLLKTHSPSLTHEGEVRQLALRLRRPRRVRSCAAGAVWVPGWGVLGQKRTWWENRGHRNQSLEFCWQERCWVLSCGKCPPVTERRPGGVPVLALQLTSKSKTNLK